MNQRLRTLLKSLTPPIIISLFRKIKPFPLKIFFGLGDMDQKLEKYLNYENGFYIEIGANDGLTQSNTAHFEKYKNWTGVLVEPIPHNYLNCIKNRSDANHIFCNACVSFDYDEKFVEILYSNLMSVPLGLKSDIPDPKEHAQIGLQFLEKQEINFSFGAVARTLNSILEEAMAPEIIDFFSLDVEGAEIEVLRGVDHSKYKFRYLLVENRSFEELDNYLRPLGYKFLEKLSPHDYLFTSIDC